ncbi:MAG: DUF1266 domain-containing protein [Zoogloeaceae bacterium]|jgi:hypothetical protein|nr:DUF1266 domain-containing protein [Zoogloeaceae bacterium]
MNDHKKSAYAPRNALNAESLKADIARRSQARGDAPEIRDWLLNHFLRHLVANFEPARRIHTREEARQALLPAPLPEWVAARLKEDAAPLVWVDPEDAQLHLLEQRLVEFLAARKGAALEGKLNRVNCPQALDLWEKEHAEMSQRIARGWRQSNPAAIQEHLKTPHGVFVEFRPDAPELRAEMAFESYRMRHCLGQFADRRALTGGYGESYAEAVEQGRMRIFSFRDASGQPHVTISLIVLPGGKLQVEQVKGKQNRPPIARYVDDLIACLDTLDTDETTPGDCVAIGIVRDGTGWRRIASITDADAQLRLIHRHPALFSFLENPSPAVEWLAAGKSPRLFEARRPASKTLAHVLDHLLARQAREDWPGLQMPAPLPPFVDPLNNFKVIGGVALCWLLSKIGFPALLVWGVFFFWFFHGVWKIIRQTQAEDKARFNGPHGFALALALPMVEARAQTGFFEIATDSLTPDTVELFRPPFLHYMDCRADADDAAARAHLLETLESTWFLADLRALMPGDDPRAALAFATCRLAFFIRNAALMGWIEKETAWRVLLLNAQRARETFASWQDYGRAYLAGRRQWVTQYRADPLGKSHAENATQGWLKVWKKMR